MRRRTPSSPGEAPELPIRISIDIYMWCVSFYNCLFQHHFQTWSDQHAREIHIQAVRWLSFLISSERKHFFVLSYFSEFLWGKGYSSFDVQESATVWTTASPSSTSTSPTKTSPLISFVSSRATPVQTWRCLRCGAWTTPWTSTSSAPSVQTLSGSKWCFPECS